MSKATIHPKSKPDEMQSENNPLVGGHGSGLYRLSMLKCAEGSRVNRSIPIYSDQFNLSDLLTHTYHDFMDLGRESSDAST